MSPVLGIDLRGDTIQTASVGATNGRRAILWLAQANVSDRMQLPEAVTLGIALPDDMVMVKNYLMPNVPGSQIEPRLRFEMEQSLLDDRDQFQFSSVKTGLPDRYLGFICRKSRVASLLHNLAIPENAASVFLPRAVALGRGFRAFCKMPGGELQGILDFTPSDLSLCLLYRGEPTALGHLKLDSYTMTDELSLKRLAMEVKTLISFRLASLSEMGLSLPMSALTIAGDIPEQLTEQLSRYFPIGLQTAVIKPSALGADLDSSTHPERFLPALGLTVI